MGWYLITAFWMLLWAWTQATLMKKEREWSAERSRLTEERDGYKVAFQGKIIHTPYITQKELIEAKKQISPKEFLKEYQGENYENV